MELDFERIGELLNDDVARTVWISCIGEPKSLYKIRTKWDIGGYLYKNITDKLRIWEIMEGLGLVSTKKGSRGSIIVTSRLDWLPGYFDFLTRNKKRGTLWEFEPFLDVGRGSSLMAVLESDAFRVCMDLKFILEEAEGEMKSEFRFVRFPFVPQKIARMEGVRFNKRWKVDLSWMYFIVSRIQMLSLFRSFEDDPRCLEYFKSAHMHIPAMTVATPKKIILLVYEHFKRSGFEIPDGVKTLFTIKDIARNVSSSMRFVKKEWPDVWKEIRKELV